MSFHELTPRQIVGELDKYIVGQTSAKRAVAVALRNRYRRDQLAPEVRLGIIPKNILMIGPTGVGKTEIARRLASLAGAPMLKIEATKFTEIGYVGREVDGIVRDLVEISIGMVEKEKITAVREAARAASELRILDLLAPRPVRATGAVSPNPFGAMWPQATPPTESERLQTEQAERLRSRIGAKLAAGELEDSDIEIEILESRLLLTRYGRKRRRYDADAVGPFPPEQEKTPPHGARSAAHLGASRSRKAARPRCHRL
jgi:ATP-dependent HslUV protease ATP-binding subunit HslU